MTTRLDRAVEKIRRLAPERQNEAADLLLMLADQDPDTVQLTDEQVAEVERRLVQGGESVSHDEVRAYFRRPAA